MVFLIEDKEITKADLLAIMAYVKSSFAKHGLEFTFSKHFGARVNSLRNNEAITVQELNDLLQKTAEKYGEKIAKWKGEKEAVIVGVKNDINMPFVMKYEKATKKLTLKVKTIIRKKGFTSSNKKLNVENRLSFGAFRIINNVIAEDMGVYGVVKVETGFKEADVVGYFTDHKAAYAEMTRLKSAITDPDATHSFVMVYLNDLIDRNKLKNIAKKEVMAG